jgi:ABC-type multidrug transport system fused ATPase/permease subunit
VKQVLALYREALEALPEGGTRFLWIYSWLLASLAVFDVAALGLLALVLGPVATGDPVELPFLGELGEGGLVGAIIAICALLIAKSAFALILTWWATRRIPRYEVAIGDRLFRAYISAPWRDRLRKNSSEIMRFTDSGVDATINAFVLPGATLLGEFVTLVLVIVTLAFVEPVIAVTSLVYLLVLGMILFFWIARHARKAGELNVQMSIRTSRLVMEIISAMKEVTLRNKEAEVADVVAETRQVNARARANIYFLGEVPRYALEAGLVGGFLVIGGVGLAMGGVEQAVAAVGLFALAGFRVAPSVTRFQAVLSKMIATSTYVRTLLDELADAERGSHVIAAREQHDLPATPERIRFSDVTFRYDPDAQPAVEKVSIDVRFGSTVAFVGSSGSGKSTMIDLVLGLLEPTEGVIRIDDEELAHVRKAWRDRVGYVPQDVAIFDATIAQNVALTWGADFDRDRVRHSLERAQLWDLIAEREGGIDARVGERGLALSGGQRQRLGIARALYADPLVLVMDEATSALDTATESQVTSAISAIGGGVTKIVVAHRLATIKDSDVIFFMRNGHVAGSGSFAELVREFPDFAEQAELAGLV